MGVPAPALLPGRRGGYPPGPLGLLLEEAGVIFGPGHRHRPAQPLPLDDRPGQGRAAYNGLELLAEKTLPRVLLKPTTVVLRLSNNLLGGRIFLILAAWLMPIT